jgi:hypothetical protein
MAPIKMANRFYYAGKKPSNVFVFSVFHSNYKYVNQNISFTFALSMLIITNATANNAENVKESKGKYT